jgi:hypothetical protein
VFHAHRLTLRTFLRQHANYGRAACQFRRARAAAGASQNGFERRAFYLNLLTYPFSRARGLSATWTALLLVAAQAAHTIGFGWERVTGAGKKPTHIRRAKRTAR